MVHVEYDLQLPVMEPNLVAELTISILTRNKILLSMYNETCFHK